MAQGILNLNNLSKGDWEYVLALAKQYKRPPKRSQLITKIQNRIRKRDPEEELKLRRIIRKLREAPVTEPR